MRSEVEEIEHENRERGEKEAPNYLKALETIELAILRQQRRQK
jgi:hypothetical protein